MVLIRIWDYFMRRKALLLTLIIFFSVSGIVSYRIFGAAQVRLEVPRSGEVVEVLAVSDGDGLADNDTEKRLSGKVGNESKSVITGERQTGEIVNKDVILVDPANDERSAYIWPEQKESRENSTPERSAQDKSAQPEVNWLTVGAVGAAVSVFVLGVRQLLKKYWLN